ncbi:MAG TPA: hypothetical protein VKQ29_15155 [Aliidongia sp.]|nr:hypothetical protein [Aliidongia sp.]
MPRIAAPIPEIPTRATAQAHARAKTAGAFSKQAVALALSALLFATVAALPAHGMENSAAAHDGALPYHAIVDGKRLQPRASDFEWPHRPDVNSADAKDVEALFRRLVSAPRVVTVEGSRSGE